MHHIHTWLTKICLFINLCYICKGQTRCDPSQIWRWCSLGLYSRGFRLYMTIEPLKWCKLNDICLSFIKRIETTTKEIPQTFIHYPRRRRRWISIYFNFSGYTNSFSFQTTSDLTFTNLISYYCPPTHWYYILYQVSWDALQSMGWSGQSSKIFQSIN